MIETQYNEKVRVLRSDNGGEYQSSNLQKYLEGHGIIHQTTCSNTPQQNGVAERKNRHLLEVVYASLIAAKILISYWGETITSVAYLINRGKYQKKIQTLDYDYHISEEDESGQSELVNQEAGELDMSGTTLEPSSNDHLETEEVIEEGRDSTIEPSPPSEQFGSEDVFTEIPNQSSSVEGVLNLEPDPFMKRLSHRHNRGIPKPTYELELSTKVKYPINNYVSNHRLSESNKSFVNQLSTLVIPNSVQEALADPRWKAAMNEKMKSLQKNETWERVECPPGKKPVGCRWIYTVKYKADAKINTIRVLPSLAANLDWPLQQFDVKNVFMHGELSEEVYMDLPPGYMVSEKQYQKVCKLKKSLYGLKQSPRAWFGRFTKSMRAFGYRQMDDRRSTSGYFTFVGGNLVTWKSYLSRQPIQLFCDNKAACDIADNLVQHDRTKHVEVDKFFIKEKLDDKIVELPKIRSENQLVDILTKAAVSSRVILIFFVALLVYVDDIIITDPNTQLIQFLKTFLHTQFKLKELGCLKLFNLPQVLCYLKGITRFNSLKPATTHVPPPAGRKDRSDDKSPPTISDSRLQGDDDPATTLRAS
ncbi:Retrovirus-related Pol polyprotein from transposon TNT 1-94 [Vitis vinifera]|uniref:Retrovirus-related Pol polyprotein from transposon TNT 1-94 n=1 Tax=Vitis vinifera TaxID=29760 RepID=A0A438E7M5_VITVI|nr:Retrovirus-related Pol polyprotein from transposon TNT 1-94 [Vitis vinifera]